MNAPLARFIWLVGLFLSLATRCPAGEPSDLPKQFVAHIGGEGAGSFYVRLEGGRLRYSAFVPDQPRREEVLTPTAQQWGRFRQALDELQVWGWAAEHRPKSPSFDGVEWWLTIEYQDRRLSARGQGAYPTVTGSSEDESTETFRRCLEAIRALLGGRPFG